MSATGEQCGELRCDVLVAGAGPAGALAARQAALGGLSVVLADPPGRGAPKIGETLPGAAVRLLARLGLGPLAATGGEVPAWRVGGLLCAWNGPVLAASDALADPYGPGIRLDRAPFDAALRQAAVAAGARPVAAGVKALRRDGDVWSVALGDGRTVRARWLVDATGRRAGLARLLGARRRRGPDLVALYRTGRPETRAGLDRTVVAAGPEGWVYAGAAGTRWVFGFHTLPATAARLRRDPGGWDAVLAACPGLTALLGGPDLALPAVARDAANVVLDPPRGDGWLACGDAALAFDPLAGQGLFNALRTGQAAAAAILTHPGGGAKRYEDELARVAAVAAARRRALYREERRWPEEPFWSAQRG